jgi:hypothetical protein
VTISGNSVTGPGGSGGGIYSNTAYPVLINVTISGNSAIGRGGGIANSAASPVLTNVTIAGNYAGSSGGGGIYNESDSDPVIRNSIIWGNITAGTTPGINNSDGASVPVISYSNVQNGSYPTTQISPDFNITDSPIFGSYTAASAASSETGGDFTLQTTSSPGYNMGNNAKYPETWANWFSDSAIPASLKTPTPGGFQDIYTARILPALANDLAGNDRTNTDTGIIDMGAYEFYP